MMEHTLITIGRQFGSGGHEVGNRLQNDWIFLFMTIIFCGWQRENWEFQMKM